MSGVTLASCAIAVPLMRQSRTDATSLVVMVASFEGSGSCLWAAAEPFVETDAAEARFAQRHERALLDASAPVSGLGVTHDLTRVADRLQIAGDDFVERCSFRAGDLDDAAAWRRERHIGDDGSNVVRRDGLEQAGRNPDYVSIPT